MLPVRLAARSWFRYQFHGHYSSGCQLNHTGVTNPATSLSDYTVHIFQALQLWCSTQASSWDSAPLQTGDQGYVSPLIDLYPERDSHLEALYEVSPADWEPV